MTKGKIIKKTTARGNSQIYPNQILVGSIPIELPTRVSVMETSFKQEGNISNFAQKVKTLKTQKQAEIVSSSTKPNEVELVSTFTKGKQISKGHLPMIIDDSQKGKSKRKKGLKGPRVQHTSKWEPRMLTDNVTPYTGPIIRSQLQIMSKPPSEESSFNDQRSDQSRDREYQKRDAMRKKKKSSQQNLKERYEARDPEVGLLGEPSGKFDYYVLYSSPKSLAIDVSSHDFPLPSWDVPLPSI